MWLGAPLGKAYTVSIPAAIDAEATEIDPTIAQASITFNRNGTYLTSEGFGGDWVSPKFAEVGDLFDIKYDYSGGTPTGPADNTYVQLNVNRTWTISQIGLGSSSCTGTISISRTGLASALDSCSTTLTATVTL